MSEPILIAENIRHIYDDGAFTLNVPEFRLHPGRIVGIIGPNGTGKSTLLRIMAGLLLARQGRVLLDATPLAKLQRRETAKRLGYLPQETSAQFDYTIEELVELGRFPHHPGFAGLGRKDREVVDRCLQKTELESLRNRPLSRLSGGERRRAFLASVLAQEPRVLLLDEPTGALDLHHQVRFFRLLRELAENGLAVAVVTHEVNLAALFGDRIVLMQNGVILGEGAPRDVLTDETVDRLYGEDVLLHRHPRSGLPIVLPAQQEKEPSS